MIAARSPTSGFRRKYLAVLGLFWAFCPRAGAIIFGPPIVDIDIPPGGSKEITLTIINESEESERFRLYATDVIKLATGELEFPAAGVTAYSCAGDIVLDPEEVVVGPLERKDVTARISIPFSATGGRYAMVMCEAVMDPIEDEGIVIAPRWRIGSVIRVKVSGRERRQATIEAVSYTPADGDEPGFFTVTVHNEGDIHVVDGEGTITVVGDDKRIVARMNFKLNGMIFPGGELDFLVAPQRSLPGGQHVAITSVSYQGRQTVPMEVPISVERLAANHVGGDEPIRVLVMPQVVTFEVPPRGFRTAGIRSQNEEDAAVDIVAELRDVVHDESGRTVPADPGTTPYSMLGLLGAEPSSFQLAPNGGRRMIRLACSAPEGASGGYYGRLLLHAQTVNNGFTLEGDIELDVRLIVPGTVEASARIADVFVEPRGEQLVVTIAIENTGNVLLEPDVEVKITDMQQEGLRDLVLPPAQVLPGGMVKATGECSALPAGRYAVTVLIDYGFDREQLYWKKEIDLP